MGVRKQWLLAIQETKKSTVGGAYEYAEIFRLWQNVPTKSSTLRDDSSAVEDFVIHRKSLVLYCGVAFKSISETFRATISYLPRSESDTTRD